MLKIDLHLHSTFSDGSLSPAALARLLKAGRISVASLTDHDSVDGVNLFLAACRKENIRAVSGVELSAAYDGVLHILGYRFDIADEALTRSLEINRKARDERNILICRKLRDRGLDISLEEVAAVAGSDVVGRPHIARILWDKGYVPNLKAAFDRYLGRGAEAYVPRLLLPPEECIRLIRGAGGLPVVAHPLQTSPELDELPVLLKRLKEAGLWGVECWFSGANVKQVYRCLEIADNLGLYPTAGSDFHGGGHSSSGVGVTVDEGILPWARFCGGL